LIEVTVFFQTILLCHSNVRYRVRAAWYVIPGSRSARPDGSSTVRSWCLIRPESRPGRQRYRVYVMSARESGGYLSPCSLAR
jgi:hypothetical protein